MEVKNLLNNKSITRTAIEHFSNDRLLMADYENAESLMRSLIGEVLDKSFFTPSLKILIQPVDDNIKDISPVERRAYLDSAEHAGGKIVVIYEKQDKLSNEKVTSLISTTK